MTRRRRSPLGREELYWNVFEDEPDEWTAAKVKLPPPNARSRTIESKTGARIVIAEDDEATRLLLDRVLTRAGFIVQACANGQLAYDAVQRDGADVVLLDWVMPVMDGPTAVACLKANVDTRGIPVVMLTSHSRIDERIVALNTGVQDFLTKPFDTRELIARIDQQLRRRGMPAVDASAEFAVERLKRHRPFASDSTDRFDGTLEPSFFDRIWGLSPEPPAIGRVA